jgi:hypothetical protein
MAAGVLRAQLLGTAHATAAQKQASEDRLVELLANAWGGIAEVAQAYQDWIAAQALPAPLPHEALVARVRWESAFAKASWAAGSQLPPEDFRAFFVIHVH